MAATNSHEIRIPCAAIGANLIFFLAGNRSTTHILKSESLKHIKYKPTVKMASDIKMDWYERRFRFLEQNLHRLQGSDNILQDINGIPLCFIEKYSHLPWNWTLLSGHCPLEIILRLQNKSWNWSAILCRWDITLEFIEQTHTKPWNWIKISQRTDLSLKFLEMHIDKPWDWNEISSASFITAEFVARHNNLAWNWCEISSNLSISLEEIDKFVNLPWHWNDISCRPDITIEFIEKHLDESLSWCSIFDNSMKFERDKYCNDAWRTTLLNALAARIGGDAVREVVLQYI